MRPLAGPRLSSGWTPGRPPPGNHTPVSTEAEAVITSSPIGLANRIAALSPITLVPFPSAEQAPEQDELPHVIGIVVGEDDGRIPHGTEQTALREALVLADHNSYHVGQLALLRRLLGAWKGD